MRPGLLVHASPLKGGRHTYYNKIGPCYAGCPKMAMWAAHFWLCGLPSLRNPLQHYFRLQPTVITSKSVREYV